MTNEEQILSILTTLTTDMKDVKKSVANLDSRLSSVENKIDTMQSDINNLVRKTDILELQQNDTQKMLSKLGTTVDNKIVPKLNSLYDGYLHNKDVTFRLVTSIDTKSEDDIDILKKIVLDHSDRINKLESK